MGAHHSSTLTSGGVGGTDIMSSSGTGAEEFPFQEHAVLQQYKVEHRLVPGSGRMMKTFQLVHQATEATAVCKAMWVMNHSNNNDTTNSPTPSLQAVLEQQREELQRIKDALQNQAHVAPFTYWIHQTEFQSTAHNILKQKQPIYLLRPHVYTTLSDRLASRPFFTLVEKLWMIHQLLTALEAMHQAKVCHGFVTTENVGLTSWNWVVLLDISSYKARTQLPDDDPSEYLFYFQDHHHHSSTTTTTTSLEPNDANNPNSVANTAAGGSGGNKKVSRNREKRCYIAPERFVSTTSAPPVKTETMMAGNNHFSKYNQLTPAMDIFSAGCVMMELWLNGDRALDLGDLMDYRRQRTIIPQLQQKLNKIESSALRAACRHMVQVDPTLRLTAKAYLERLQAAEALPTVMETCLEPLIEQISNPRNNILTPDARLAWAAATYDQVLWDCKGLQDPQGSAYLKRVLGHTMTKLVVPKKAAVGGVNDSTAEVEETKTSPATTKPQPPSQETPAVTSTTRESVTQDLFAETEALLKKLDSLSFLGDDDDVTAVSTEVSVSSTEEPASAPTPTTEAAADATTTKKTASTTTTSIKRNPLTQSSLLIYMQVILANIRHVQRPTSKLVALELLGRLCRVCGSDEVRLQRMVPVSISLLQDQDTLVRAAALKFLTHTLNHVQSFPPSDSKIFPQYIFKRVSPLMTDPSLIVRLAFAECIAGLAETALRFLDISHAVRLYEAIGGGSSTSGAAAAAAATAGGGTSSAGDGGESSSAAGAQKSTEQKKKTTPANPGVFTDDVAKLLGDTPKVSDKDKSNSTAQQGGEERVDTTTKSFQQQHHHGSAGHLLLTASSPTGKTLISSNYQEELASLQETVSRWVVHIMTDPSEHSSPTKRALLDKNHLSRLCTFFGLEGVMTFILPQILAFLNDRKDFQLRAALFQQLPSVCRIVGRAATEHFVLPCLESGLVDGTEHVVGAAIRCLAELIDVGLISRAVLLGNLVLTTPTADHSMVELTSDG
jgi:phosphoinositide-3-kinase regulatory subunit 4